jgi:curli biogenesis system outer membrane secretion channel CsgG
MNSVLEQGDTVKGLENGILIYHISCFFHVPVEDQLNIPDILEGWFRGKPYTPCQNFNREATVVNRALVFFPLICLISFWPAAAAVPKKERPRMVVLDFPVANGAYEGWNGWGYGGGENHISSALQELMTTAMLTKGTGQIRLMERKRLEEVLGEQKLGASGLVDEDTAVKMGKLVGCQYMVTGKVTRFAYKKSGFGTGWGVTALMDKINPNAGAAASVAGDVHVQKASFSGRLDVRLIDVQTGEILAVAKEEGTIKDLGVKVAGTGSDIQYDQELVNKIFEPITDKISDVLIKKLAEIRAREANGD